MLNTVSDRILDVFANIPQMFLFGFSGVLLVFLGFISVKVFWRLRGNTAFTSYQYGVIAPVQYGDRGAKPTPEVVFAQRLDDMVEAEDAYDLAKLMPQARQLGAIANTTFRTAPVLDTASLAVLGLIEEIVRELDSGFRVLMHTSLESLVDLASSGADRVTNKLSMTGIELKFAVLDRYGRLAMAVDFQGDDERTKQDFINRSIVIEILRKAGVWYLEVPQNYSEQDARAQILAVLRGKAAISGDNEEVA